MYTLIGVMGGSSSDKATTQRAFQLGQAIAKQGWTMICGGRNAGIMRAISDGVHQAGGLSIGILPGHDYHQLAPNIHIPIITGMGDARNVINILSSRVVIAFPGGMGTISEIALALKAGRPVIMYTIPPNSLWDEFHTSGQLMYTTTLSQTIKAAHSLLNYCELDYKPL